MISSSIRMASKISPINFLLSHYFYSEIKWLSRYSRTRAFRFYHKFEFICLIAVIFRFVNVIYELNCDRFEQRFHDFTLNFFYQYSHLYDRYFCLTIGAFLYFILITELYLYSIIPGTMSADAIHELVVVNFDIYKKCTSVNENKLTEKYFNCFADLMPTYCISLLRLFKSIFRIAAKMTILWYLIFVIDAIKWGMHRDDREYNGKRADNI